MGLLIAMIFVGAVNLAICDPSDPYTDNCKPPIGVGNGTAPNNSTGLVYKDPIKPIERCCPVCEACVAIGGRCKLNWIPEMYPDWCDFTSVSECRDYSCTCCVKCADDECSPCTETGGECRVECRVDEIEDTNNRCLYSPDPSTAVERSFNPKNECKCCKRCEATSECTDAFGKCVTDPSDCPVGSFASTGCCGGCYCCKPVYEGVPGGPGVPDGCSEAGAYCTDTDECANGYYSCFGVCQRCLQHAGLTRIELGYCCVPKLAADPGPGRRSAALPNLMNQLMGKEAYPPYGRGHDQF